MIIPLLEKEHRSATRKLNEINQELRLDVKILLLLGEYYPIVVVITVS